MVVGALCWGSTVAGEPKVVVDRTTAPAARCFACHKADGAQRGVPSIAGRPAPEIAERLRFYRDAGAKRDVMTTRASSLDEADIEALARYFAGLPLSRLR